jgi:nitroreductase/NAD-dependent dihydropyrimidine dehydrogenase PreA subunit
MDLSINLDLCKACGICGEICPRHIPETIETKGEKVTTISPQRIDLCMACGHCVAVCPNSAIQLNGISSQDYVPVIDHNITHDQLVTLMRQRRSIRRYKDQPVSREIIGQIIQAVHTSPTGTGSTSTGVIVIDNPQTLKRISDLIFDMYEKMEVGLKSPIGRRIIKRTAGKKNFQTLQDFVMPGMHWYLRWYRQGVSDEVLRGCPTLMLFHSPIREPVAQENCLLAAFNATLIAQTLGIGTGVNDCIPPICNKDPEIRKILELPDDREVYASLTMGYPKYKFNRVPPRELAEVRYIG